MKSILKFEVNRVASGYLKACFARSSKSDMAAASLPRSDSVGAVGGCWHGSLGK